MGWLKKLRKSVFSVYKRSDSCDCSEWEKRWLTCRRLIDTSWFYFLSFALFHTFDTFLPLIIVLYIWFFLFASFFCRYAFGRCVDCESSGVVRIFDFLEILDKRNCNLRGIGIIARWRVVDEVCLLRGASPRASAGSGDSSNGERMPGGRRGLVAPQNTFLENIIRRSSSQRKYWRNYISWFF